MQGTILLELLGEICSYDEDERREEHREDERGQIKRQPNDIEREEDENDNRKDNERLSKIHFGVHPGN